MSRADVRLRVATRGSALALKQTDLAVTALRDAAAAAGLTVTAEVVAIRTQGDRLSDVPFEAIGPKGVFAHDIQRALQNREVDVAVHSLKDLPAAEPPELVIGAVLPRADPRDVAVCTSRRRLAELPPGARVGTSSARRRALLALLHPHLRAVALRGNVDTRLRKVTDGEIDAAVLAAAGLVRLGRADAITEWLAPEDFVPPPGQGAVVVELREDSLAGDLSWIARADDLPSSRAVEAERVFMRVMEGGCEVPLGAWARTDAGVIRCEGFVGTADGRLHARASVSGDDPASVGLALAQELNRQGADRIVEAVRSTEGDG